MVSAHAVNSAAGGRGGGTEINVAQGGPVRTGAHDRTGEELIEAGGSAVDVAADVVRIVSFHLRGVHGVAGENRVAETGSESFDLPFDNRSPVDAAAVRDMTISPSCVF